MAAPPPTGQYVVAQYNPAVNVNTHQQRTGPRQTPHFLQRFIKGEPKTLGAIQVLNGLLHIGLGGVLCSFLPHHAPFIVYTGVPFWAAVFYIISGSLSIAAEMSGLHGMVRGSLGMNIVSIVMAGVEIIIIAVTLGDNPSMHCKYRREYYEACVNEQFHSARQGIVAVLFILTLLEFCIAFSTSVFGCKSVCCLGFPIETENHFGAVQFSPRTQTQWMPAQDMQSAIPLMQQGGAPPQGLPAVFPMQQGGAPPQGLPAVFPMQQGAAQHQGTVAPPPPPPQTTTPPSYYEKYPDNANLNYQMVVEERLDEESTLTYPV